MKTHCVFMFTAQLKGNCNSTSSYKMHRMELQVGVLEVHFSFCVNCFCLISFISRVLTHCSSPSLRLNALSSSSVVVTHRWEAHLVAFPRKCFSIVFTKTIKFYCESLEQKILPETRRKKGHFSTSLSNHRSNEGICWRVILRPWAAYI